jgi:hypothetical protein
LQTTHELIVAGIAVRRVRWRPALAALDRAMSAARQAGIPALLAEVENAVHLLHAPVARQIAPGATRLLRLDDVEALFASGALVIDGCRHAARSGERIIPLAGRGVLFSLAQQLAESWPSAASRDALVRRAFRRRRADESLRARLRVEIGRLRRLLAPIAHIDATADGFLLKPRAAGDVVLLARLVEEEHAAVLALLADGESWSTSALALALRTSQRSVQRALDDLARRGKVQAFGAGRTQRWMTPPLPGIATTLLLPAPLPGD